MQRPLRFLLFVLLSCTFVSEAAAQAREEQPPMRFSVAGGLNISRLTFPLQVGELPFEFDINIDNGSRVGLVAGGLVDFRVAPGVGVLTGGLFSTRGGKLEIDLSDLPEIIPDPGFPVGTFEIDLRMTYIDVPAFVAVGVAGSGPHRFEVIGGGLLGIKTSARVKFTFGGVSADESFSSGLPGADFGVSVGGRYSCGNIFAAAYYTWGLTDLAEGDGPESIKHRYLTLIGGWRF